MVECYQSDDWHKKIDGYLYKSDVYLGVVD